MPPRKKTAAAFFAPLRGKRYTTIAVIRKDPPSGYLGAMPPDLTEAALAEKWGGGSYRLEARNAANHIRQVRMVQIAGEPIGHRAKAPARRPRRKAPARRPRRMPAAEELRALADARAVLARPAAPQRIEIVVSPGECPACGGPLPLPAIVLRTGE